MRNQKKLQKQFAYPTLIRVAIIVALAVSQSAQAATFIVDDTDDAVDMNPGDGVCVTNASTCTLRAAIQESNALVEADMIELPNGIYNIAIAGSDEEAAASGDLDINDDLTIEGASATGTIIDGGALDRIFDIAPVDANDPEIEVTISRLTVRNGEASGGGGVRYGSSLTVTNVVISDNVSTFAGGGIANTIGIFDDPRLTLVNVIVTRNTAPFLGGNGGGIDAGDSTSLSITRSRISENSASQSGGGVNAGSNMVMTDVVVSGNSSNIGGGIRGGAMIISDSTITGNNSEQNGGGIQNTGGIASIITNSTISHNMAGTSGGGIANSGTMTLTDVTIANNSADDPENSPTGAGGGILQFGSDSETMMRNIIIADNDSDNCGGLQVTSAGHNLASDGSCNLSEASDLPNTNAQLAAQMLNGGFTPTIALLANSPAIDAGDDNNCPATDQRGFARPIDGDGDNIVRCDIGAYEFGATPSIGALIDLITDSDFPRAIKNRLIARLRSILDLFRAGSTPRACREAGALVDRVEALLRTNPSLGALATLAAAKLRCQ